MNKTSPISVRLSFEQIKRLEELGLSFTEVCREMIDFFINDEAFINNLVKEKELQLKKIKEIVKKTRLIRNKKEKANKIVKNNLLNSIKKRLKNCSLSDEEGIIEEGLQDYVNICKGDRKDYLDNIKKWKKILVR